MNQRPPLLLANLVAFSLAILWVYLRHFLFAESLFSLTYVLPLLITLWTRRSWQITAMAGLFVASTFLNFRHSRFLDEVTPLQRTLFYASTYVNILVGAAATQLILHFRLQSLRHATLITEQNAELEAQAEELARQNEEIKAQSEELAQQNEEIESQSEELTRQNDELHGANERLGIREEMLQDLLQSSRTALSDEKSLTNACQRALRIIGPPADRIGLLDLIHPGHFLLCAQAGEADAPPLPSEWPAQDSLAGLVAHDNKTAYVSDLSLHPELAAPFGTGQPVRSLLATPLHADNACAGVLIVCSREPTHWTEEQFHLVEWIAAKCSHIMECHRWHRALTQRTAELDAANRAKDDFLAMLSHELRTPLTPVLAAAGVLAHDHRLPPDVREDLAMIRSNVTIQSRLIDDLLDLTRIERGKLDLNRQPFRLAPLLKDAAAIVTPDLDANEQRLNVRSDVPEHYRVFGDAARLQQVLWNLLQNAVKFSPPRSQISLEARLLPDDASRVAITVDDEGPGIPAADADRVFKPFEQIRQGRRAGRDTGLGLGLAIAKVIVEQHGGRLTVGPNPGGLGSRFTVELPVTPAPESAGNTPAEDAGDNVGVPRGPGVNILLVEDHFDTGRVIVRLLKSEGHHVIHARDAADALRHFAANQFDLVISDLGLPDESGLVLMKKLRELQPDIPGLCMSGYGMERDLQACKEVGFSEHLTKPVEVQRLLAAIKRTLDPASRSAS